ncbi:S41 family peptidase [Anaerolentibacter hominis]|uniref:S41 family peptidase n=1 Tax=Anaerolentibacter hominis TaxID=3079009 RepID=UPI0031B83750
MENKNNSGFLRGMLTGCIIMMVISVFGFYAYFTSQNGGVRSPEPYVYGAVNLTEVNQKVSMLEKYIDKFYLFDTDAADMTNGIYKGLMNGLGDPYSVYYTEEEYAAMMESAEGAYVGIGSYVSQLTDGRIMIVKPFEDGPADKAGILPGDILLTIDGVSVTGMDLETAVAKMKGEAGTTVDLTFYREGETEDIAVTVTRAEVEVPTIAYEMLDNKIGYILISSFEKATVHQFTDAVDDLEKDGAKGLLIDLRDNGGGNLDAVVDMVDYLLPAGNILSTKDKNGVGESYDSTDDHQVDLPLAILVNGSTASASEIFAGAVQDRNAGQVVGTLTFGKGIVQSILPFENGEQGAIKLTTSEYFLPSGRSIHKVGITPDVEVELSKKAKAEIKKDGALSRKNDNQLKKAQEVLLEMMGD